MLGNFHRELDFIVTRKSKNKNLDNGRIKRDKPDFESEKGKCTLAIR